jgi:hypothetical protein
MLNLNVGGVVFHAGKKRTIEAIKDVVGQTFLKLKGHAYLVRLEHVKPVVRLTDVVRAEILVETATRVLGRWPEDSVWTSFTVGKSPFKVTRRDFEEASRIVTVHPLRERGVQPFNRFVGRGPANTYARFPAMGGPLNA